MSESLPALNFTWRRTDDALTVYNMHKLVTAHLLHGMVRPDALDHFERHVSQSGQILGCFLDDGTMVAYGVIGLKSHIVDHMALLLDADVNELAVLDGASSLDPYRGYNLHLSVIDQRIAHAGKIGRRVIGATVYPENIRSLRGMFHAGLHVYNYAYMYNGLPRLIFKRELDQPAPAWRHEADLRCADHDAHKAAVADGLRGYACRQGADGGWLISYGRA